MNVCRASGWRFKNPEDGKGTEYVSRSPLLNDLDKTMVDKLHRKQNGKVTVLVGKTGG